MEKLLPDEDKEDIEFIKNAAQSILKDEIEHLQLVSPVALKLLRLSHEDDTRIENLSQIIETEPVLAAKILKQVNSAAYALPNKMTSIKRAVNMLGFSTVRQLALNLQLHNGLIQLNSSKKSFDLLFFWQHCLYVASLSRRIAIALNYPDPDLVYTGGLMHDIGKVVLENYGRVTYSDFIASVGQNKHSTKNEERSFFGITHHEMGYIFCLEWQLPSSITAIVACHHNQPTENSPYSQYKTEIAIVSFANYIAWIQGIGSANYDSHPTLQSTLLDTIGIDRLNLESLLQQVDQDMQSTQEFYKTQLPGLTTLRATLVKATINLSQLSANKSLANPLSNRKAATCLTAPHHSLNPSDFIPKTLEAIQDEFSFDRSIMFTIDPKRRCLVASYCWPKSILPANLQSFEVNIGDISGSLLKCLREKTAVIINAETEVGNPVIQHLKATQFIAIPVLHHNHLIGMLYADNSLSKQPMHEQLLPEIMPIAYELGIAMSNAQQYGQEKKHAQLDHLTQLFNKRMVINFLTETFQEEPSKLANIAIGFIDIDRFKILNDTCGHQAGDDALKIVADILRDSTRPGDFIGRYGGEEFLFVLKNTNETGAQGYAERIRSEIERRGKILRQRFHGQIITVSIGIAMYNHQYTNYTEMIDVADRAMYRAKNEGRNKVVMFSGPEASGR